MSELLVQTFKYALLANAIGMLIWMTFRMRFSHQEAWILLDGLLVIASIVVADRYRDLDG
jgi:hypothetical protein